MDTKKVRRAKLENAKITHAIISDKNILWYLLCENLLEFVRLKGQVKKKKHFIHVL